MDVKKFIPVGSDNAIDATILLGGHGLTGKALLESADATEVSLQSNTPMDSRLWSIGVDEITALAVTPPAEAAPSQP